jgi:hypothetical protein
MEISKEIWVPILHNLFTVIPLKIPAFSLDFTLHGGVNDASDIRHRPVIQRAAGQQIMTRTR